jgi:hypothetical protein
MKKTKSIKYSTIVKLYEKAYNEFATTMIKAYPDCKTEFEKDKLYCEAAETLNRKLDYCNGMFKQYNDERD